MSAEGNTSLRLYRVLLMDRTTSPKVNRFIRELTDINIWDASNLMNAVPSIIISDITLHEAIDIKSKLGKFGLRARIESVDAPQMGAPEKKATPLQPTIDEKDAAPPQDEKPKPAPVEEVHTDKPGGQPPEAEKPMPPGRLKRRRRKKVSVFKAVLPLLILLIVVIIVIYYAGSCNEEPLGFFKDRLVVREQAGVKTSQGPDFVQSEQDILERIKQLQGQQGAGQGEAGEESGAALPESSAALIYSEIPLTGEEGAGKTPQSGEAPSTAPEGGLTMEIAAGEDEESEAQAEEPPSEFEEESKADSGGISPFFKGEGTSRQPSEFVGPATGAGITLGKLNAVMQDANEAVERGDSSIAAQDFNRLNLAEDMVASDQAEVEAIINSAEFKELMNALKGMKEGCDLQGGADFYPEIVGANLQVHTNLPDSAIVGVEVEYPGGGKPIRHVLPVMENIVEIPYDEGLPSGVIIIKVHLIALKDPPDRVLQVLGKKGEKLSGPFHKGKGKLEYRGFLTNRVARWRGEITEEEAESELNLIASGAGLIDYKLEDFDEFNLNALPFITLVAQGVEEEDFIFKACRSAGLLTQDMDNPPQYFRIIVNGHQYFIRTYICRRLLREYGEDEAAGFEYLLNHLLAW